MHTAIARAGRLLAVSILLIASFAGCGDGAGANGQDERSDGQVDFRSDARAGDDRGIGLGDAGEGERSIDRGSDAAAAGPDGEAGVDVRSGSDASQSGDAGAADGSTDASPADDGSTDSGRAVADAADASIDAAADARIDGRDTSLDGRADARADGPADAGRGADGGFVGDARSSPDASSGDAGCPPDEQACSTGCCPGFLVERVDPPIGGGGAIALSLAFDAQAVPHLAYVDLSDAVLMYATQVSGAWVLEEVDGKLYGPDVSVSLALDGTGGVHIAYLSDDGVIRYASRSGNGWTLERLNDGATHSSSVSIALDAQGVVHASYFVSGDSDLGHAWRAPGGDWNFEIVDGQNGDDVGSYSSLALDADGHPHISYWDFGNDDLKYAAWDGSTWKIEAVDTTGNVGVYTSLALDATGKPRIAYRTGDTFYLKYAEWNGSTWSVTTPLAHSGLPPHLVLDGSGAPWISEYGYDLDRPALYHRTGNTWVKELFTSDAVYGQETAVAREPSGNVALAYTTPNYDDDLRLARLSSGGGWDNQPVDTLVNAGRGSQLALDATGIPHISYIDDTSHEVWYATRANSGIWTRRMIRAVGGDGIDSSIAVEPAGRPHVVWYNGLTTILEHGVWNGSSWDIETVDSTPYAGTEPSVALDSSGQPRIAYVGADGSLRYAVRGPSGGYTIESAAPAGRRPSLVLDSAGGPHVVYFDPVALAFVYTSRTSSGWTSESIDTADTNSHPSDIQLDASGQPHVCYQQVVGGIEYLRYAFRSNAGVWTKDGPAFANSHSGIDCSIALDAEGQPHISHGVVSPGGSSLFYSWLAGGTWTNMELDFDLSTGQSTSIALDGAGSAHISYAHKNWHELKYAQQK